MKLIKNILRKVRPNPLNVILKKAKKKNQKRFLLTWNRGLGDIPLGLYAVIYKIREYIPDAFITFLIREDLKEGFELLEGIEVIIVPFWRRGIPFDVDHTLAELKIDKSHYDVIIDRINPTHWVKWQLGKLVPKLKWNDKWDQLVEKFKLSKDNIYIGVQAQTETKHGFWRNWSLNKWQELFNSLDKRIKVIIFGMKKDYMFEGENIIDLREKTSLFEMLSIIKNRCSYLLVPDSGVLSIVYYLNVNFPIKVVSLWADSKQGILKQNVPSPNSKLIHEPIIYTKDELYKLSIFEVKKHLFPMDIRYLLNEIGQQHLKDVFEGYLIKDQKKLLTQGLAIDLNLAKKQRKAFARKKIAKFHDCLPLKKSSYPISEDIMLANKAFSQNLVGAIYLAGGQGTRLGFDHPKGMFEINDKSLFQRICEKALCIQKKYKTRSYISFMTSFLNHNETVEYFNKNNFFGMNKNQIDFFEQESLPFLEKHGRWVVENKSIVMGPDGNGGVFKQFYKSGLYDKYLSLGIKYVTINPIDNLLAEPFDNKLVGFHLREMNDISLKCIKKDSDFLKMGFLAKEKGRLKVIEYSEIEDNKEFIFCNTGSFVVSMEFVDKIKDIDMPFHFAWKKINNKAQSYAWKSEQFIFDILDHSYKVKILCDDIDLCFAPLKDENSLIRIKRVLNLEKSP